VVIPVLNGAEYLARCLEALKYSQTPALEYIVVDDGSSDNSRAIAEACGAMLLRTQGRSGPAAARNLGALHAKGELLLFIDSDVRVRPDTLTRIQARFAADPGIDALLGSYDDEPAASGFVSQYKNLQHHYVHQHGRTDAATFWSGCGAIRAEVFRAADGFSEAYARPCIEDIELGYRLRAAQRRIVLDPAIQVTHLKHYHLTALWRSDIFDRALPWTQLILQSRNLPNDLNLALGQRVCAALVVSAVGLVPICLATAAPTALAALPLALAILINWDFNRFLARKRGWIFAARSIPLQLAYYLYGAIAFAAGLTLYLLASPDRNRQTSDTSRPERSGLANASEASKAVPLRPD
jgi:GT2 family glycosyltransferase